MIDVFKKAFDAKDIEIFIDLIFPKAWGGVGSRILETGAEFVDSCVWAPRWSKIPRTIRKGDNDVETYVKSCMYRLHDCLHQLWGLPIPSNSFTEEERYLFKRAGMCGEVAVLAITEFLFGEYIYDNFPDAHALIWKRNAVPLIKDGGALQHKTISQIAIRLDGLLHKKLRPQWVRNDAIATAFCDDYVPMLEDDRLFLDQHWQAMMEERWVPTSAPNSRYSSALDGLELTVWMINDFLHLTDTDVQIDHRLRKFNQTRREKIVLPLNW